MAHILVPYHLDEHLPDLGVPISPHRVVTAELPAGDPWQRMAHLYAAVADAVSEATAAVGLAVVCSGDCTTSFAAVAGLQRAGIDPAIVWFDAHGDVQTLETTSSGYLGGMPLRMLTGYRPDLITEPLGIRPVPESRVLLVDARDLDPPEADYLAQAAIRRLPVPEVTADTLPEGPLYVHVDLDVIDPVDLPGLLYPAPGGPRLPAVVAALGRILATGRVAALGLACTWRPGAGGAELLRRPLADLLGSTGGGHS